MVKPKLKLFKKLRKLEYDIHCKKSIDPISLLEINSWIMLFELLFTYQINNLIIKAVEVSIFKWYIIFNKYYEKKVIILIDTNSQTKDAMQFSIVTCFILFREILITGYWSIYAIYFSEHKSYIAI